MPKGEPKLLYETKENGRIAVITLNRPEVLNAFDRDLSAQIYQTWQRFAEDEDCWVAIWTGAGDRAFCTGQDLKERADLEKEGGDAPYRGRRPIFLVPEAFNVWKPTIAAINGYAIAGGWNLAEACDIRIAAEHAEMGVAEVRWNQGGSFVGFLTRQLTLAHALEIVLWGDKRISAQRAYEMGWVNRVVPKEKLMDEAMEWANRMLYLAPRAMRNMKELIYRGHTMTEMEISAFAQSREYNLRGMEDSLEGPLAFAEKRLPRFKNR